VWCRYASFYEPVAVLLSLCLHPSFFRALSLIHALDRDADREIGLSELENALREIRKVTRMANNKSTGRLA
jgi:hypothetical protein